jgi:hypothetical protein
VVSWCRGSELSVRFISYSMRAIEGDGICRLSLTVPPAVSCGESEGCFQLAESPYEEEVPVWSVQDG